jgi:hypothetical protein
LYSIRDAAAALLLLGWRRVRSVAVLNCMVLIISLAFMNERGAKDIHFCG